ncbi:MAG: 4-alpha-glucanotransferase [Simkaniaceae bacterium]|nr:MAG: 4-alpha-glucanotransferase [Simkaniaceae bacterium]
MRIIFFLIPVLLFGVPKNLPIDSYLTKKAWGRIGVRDHYGIDLPLLGIHSSHSSGNGEFLDLIPFVDWMAKNGFDVLQLLPLNDTDGIASPYSPISFNALHPIYLSLELLPFLGIAPPDLIRDLKALKKYNETERVEYETVLERKREWLREYIGHFSAQLMLRPSYQEFLSQASSWATEYALYKILRARYGHNWDLWPEEASKPTADSIKKLKELYAAELPFYLIVQSLCFEQMEYVHHYANKKGVFLLGDMTFLISHNSFEVWRHPDAFKINLSTGTPPDIFQKEGQYWGLPPYNWEVIEKSHAFLILNRVKTFSQIYDIYRLDFAKGYFYQYEIPIDHPPKSGKFFPDTLEKAIKNGKKLLAEMIEAAPILPVAEDLGMAPQTREVLDTYGIPGLELFVFRNSIRSPEEQVLPGEKASLLSVSQLTNHDNPPLRLWWNTHPDRAKAIAKNLKWEYSPKLSLVQQQELLWMDMHSKSLFHIQMFQDLLPPDLSNPSDTQRINIPGTVTPDNWTYRYKLSVEEIAKNLKLEAMIKTILAPSSPMSKQAHVTSTK